MQSCSNRLPGRLEQPSEKNLVWLDCRILQKYLVPGPRVICRGCCGQRTVQPQDH